MGSWTLAAADKHAAQAISQPAKGIPILSMG
jgi:hypothetical protein